MNPRAASPRPVALLAGLVCALSLTVCLLTGWSKVRQPVTSAMSPPGFDFAWIYAAGRCWIEGKDPYRGEIFGPVMRRVVPANICAHVSARDIDTSAGIGYPPNALPVFALLALLPWQQALLAWWTLTLLAVCVLLFCTVDAIVPAWRLESKLLFIALMAQSRLIQMTAYRGQTGIFAFAAIMLAVWLARRQAPLWSGLSLGFSLIKFTFTLPLLLFYSLRREWKVVGTTLLVATAFLLLGIARTGGLSTLRDYRVTTHLFLAPGTTNDTSLLNPGNRLGIDNVDVLLFNLVGDHSAVVMGLHLLLFVGFVAVLAGLTFQTREDPLAYWLLWSAWNLFGYLFFYHRFYDAILLWPVMAVLLECWRRRCGPRLPLAYAIATLSLLIFILSIQSLDIRVAARLSHSAALRPFAPLHVWLVGSVFVLILWLCERATRASALESNRLPLPEC